MRTQTSPTTPPTGQAADTPVVLETYRDPGGYFTMQIPHGWQVRRDSGMAYSGNAYKGTRSNYRDVFSVFTPYSPNGDDDVPYVSVEYLVFTSGDTPPPPDCKRIRREANTALGGVPAISFGDYQSRVDWELVTTAAAYTVTYGKPGTLKPTPRPLITKPTVTAAAELGQRIVPTFTPTPAIPACPL